MNVQEPAPDRDELHDRLIDHALRELAGGQRPPDLSEQILAAAAAHSSLTPAGGQPMNAPTAPRRAAARFGWKTWAVAATLLVATGGVLLPAIQPAREAARRNDARLLVPATNESVNNPEQEIISGRGLEEKVRALSMQKKGKWTKESQRESNELMMGVTPHIIIQEEEEQRLGIAPEGDAAPAEAAPASTPGKDAALPASTADLNLPQRQESFGLSTLGDQSGGGQQAAANTSNRYAEQSELGPGASQSNSNGVHDRVAGAQPPRIWHKNIAYGYGDGRLGQRNDSLYATEPPRIARVDELSQEVAESIVEGQGPGQSGDQYARIVDNPFVPVSVANTDHRLSTFSIDVDTASYANVRQFIMQSGALPPPDAVRIEELVNYFDYDYSPPTEDAPFAANVEVGQCPWQPDHRLVRIGIKGREMDRRARPQSNLVFLIDVSGSMNEPAKLPLLVEGMRMLARKLGENDRVAIVVYASSEGLVLDATPGTDQSKIIAALDQLRAGGSTAGGAGIQLAYQKAIEHFIKGGVNRVILCTDGDFNVGVTSSAELERLAEAKAKETGVFLTVLGFGRGNLNDAMMEQIADKGNGNYHYVDTQKEARKVLVEEMTGTLVAIAKDVKIQVEFNPAKVAGYRLIGYENRVLAAEDFNDDQKDAGEIGAGHTVTALYEVVPAGMKVEASNVDDLKYGVVASATTNAPGEDPLQRSVSATNEAKPPSNADANDLLTVKIRYKQPDGDKSTKLEFPVADDDKNESLAGRSDDFQFAAAVASFGMILRNSPHKGNATLASVAEIAQGALGEKDPHGYRQEFVDILRRAKELSGE